MIVRHFVNTEPACLSYLFGCGGRGVGAVVDPVGPTKRYVDAAADTGLQLRYVIDTHSHADHRSAARALARATGAAHVMHAEAPLAFDFQRVADGEVLDLGNVTAEVLHTPGHTPDHLCLLVRDHTRSEEPWFVLTGHTLMVGDMGRTELVSRVDEGARALFQSGRRLARLPDYVQVFPGAFSGSVCGRNLSGNPYSTIGFERRYNRAFRIEDEAEFIEAMMREIPEPPPLAAEYRADNTGVAARS